MDLDTYRVESRKTVKYDENTENKRENLSYLVDGLSEETGEIAEKVLDLENENPTDEEILSEVGDVMWFSIRICDELDYDLGHIFNNYSPDYDCSNLTKQELVLKISQDMGEISGVSSKNVRDGKEFEVRKEIRELYYTLEMFLRKFDSGITEVAEKNINKLLDRDERGKIKGDGDKR